VTTEAALTSSIEELPDEAAILFLSGEIDLATAPQLVAHFQELADRGLTDVIVDAREVSFIDSTGLHGLIKGKRIIHEKGSQVILVPSLQMRRLLEMVFPEPIFTACVNSMEEAHAMLGAKETTET
jgi:anti-sigma B factor antagonist